MQRRPFLPGLLRIGLWLLLLPFLVATLLPQDMMVARGAGGQITMVLCAPDGPQEMVIDLATGEPAEAGTSSTCDWAAAQMAALPVIPLTLSAQDVVALPLRLAIGRDLPRASLPELHHQPRAPPVLT